VTRAFLDFVLLFRKDDRGAFAVIFAIIAVVLVAMSGATVDFTSVQQSRTRAQVALDAAALALQPSIYITPLTTAQNTIQTQVQALLLNRLGDAATTWVDCTSSTTPPPCAHVDTPTIDTTNGQLTLQATLRVPMNFVSLVGVKSMSLTIVSAATRKKLKLEVAMVLDNSGSMAYTMGYNKVLNPNPNNYATRMATLQSSAVCASNILFYGVSSCSASTSGITPNANVRMALVPFTSAVNVGSSNSSATWLDRTGTGNSITLMHFDSNDYSGDTFTGPVDRVGLFGKVKYNNTALSWGGCVEARVNNGTNKQYDTDDTTPDTAQPDTLFTPYFAPDEPGASTSSGTTVNSENFNDSYLSDTPSVCNWTGTCAYTNTTTTTTTAVTTTQSAVATTRNTSGTITAGPTTTVTGQTTVATVTPVTVNAGTFTASFGTTQSGSNICTCPKGSAQSTGTPTTTGPNSNTNGPNTSSSSSSTGTGSRKLTTTTVTTTTTTTVVSTSTQPVSTTCSNQTYTPTNLSNQVLQERMCKYNVSGGGIMSNAPGPGSVFGPNGDCPANAITPLTATPATISTAINAMVPLGATNIQEGSAWGFRVLSPGAPFTEGDQYNQSTSKVMIVMTDGENTLYPATDNFNDAQYYSAYGYPSDGRLGAASTDVSVLEGRVNTRLATTCTNAKAAGITIYTIGVGAGYTSDPTGNEALLTKCASQTGFAYFPNTAADLQAAFVSIATQLAALRLAQ
jgi:Flp pilus assembly protein TadG